MSESEKNESEKNESEKPESEKNVAGKAEPAKVTHWSNLISILGVGGKKTAEPAPAPKAVEPAPVVAAPVAPAPEPPVISATGELQIDWGKPTAKKRAIETKAGPPARPKPTTPPTSAAPPNKGVAPAARSPVAAPSTTAPKKKHWGGLAEQLGLPPGESTVDDEPTWIEESESNGNTLSGDDAADECVSHPGVGSCAPDECEVRSESCKMRPSHEEEVLDTRDVEYLDDVPATDEDLDALADLINEGAPAMDLVRRPPRRDAFDDERGDEDRDVPRDEVDADDAPPRVERPRSETDEAGGPRKRRRRGRGRGGRREEGEGDREPLREGPGREGPSREGASREAPSREGGSRERLDREGGSREGASREGGSREFSSREPSAREGSSREPSARSSSTRESSREPSSREGREGRDSRGGSSRSSSSRGPSSRDSASRDSASRDSSRTPPPPREPRVKEIYDREDDHHDDIEEDLDREPMSHVGDEDLDGPVDREPLRDSREGGSRDASIRDDERRPRRRRRRRGSEETAAEGERGPRRPSEPNERVRGADPAYRRKEEPADLEDDLDEDDEPVAVHRNLPTWEDALSAIVAGNIENRARTPQQHYGNRSRGSGGGSRDRGGSDRGGGDRGGRERGPDRGPDRAPDRGPPDRGPDRGPPRGRRDDRGGERR